jgi:hypothetical protein
LLPIWLHAGKLSNKDKDGIEEEVGATVRAAGQQLEQLKGSVVAAQQQQQSYEDGGGAAINEHTAAHLHGVVGIAAAGAEAAEYAPGALLAITCSQTTYHSRIRQQQCHQSRCTLLWALSAPADIAPCITNHLPGCQVLVLVERLQGVAASFDRCRAVRYQQGLARELAHSRGTQAFLQVGRGATFCLSLQRSLSQLWKDDGARACHTLLASCTGMDQLMHSVLITSLYVTWPGHCMYVTTIKVLAQTWNMNGD